MHIPDGFLSTPVWAALNAVSIPAVGCLARRAQSHVHESRIPLLGVMGAFVFAAQMINFPVGLGTSGHLVGSALLTYVLGPAAAAVVMTAILAVQALVFQDGGILALGANVFNMALIGVLAAWIPYRFLGAGGWRKAAIFLGGFLSVTAGAALALSQLVLSGVAMPPRIAGLTLSVFAAAAVLEGIITVAVTGAIEAINPGWIQNAAAAPRKVLGTLAAAAVFLAAVGVLFASAHPDGLERVAGETGIAGRAHKLIVTPLLDYEWSAFQGEWARKASAGTAGILAVALVCLLAGRIIARRRRSA